MMPSSSSDNELLPLSYLSQFGYCPRRCALLLLEQVWIENEYTAAGRMEHERVHTARIERRGNLITLYEFPVFSRDLGVSGLCDCVELHTDINGVNLPFGKDKYMLYPIEYKHGVVRDEREYQIQLCAQAMSLEERYGCVIHDGALFFIDAHRRREQVDLTRKDSLAEAEKRLTELSLQLNDCSAVDSLRGLEGVAAAAYFGVFNQMIKSKDETMQFSGRNRRPPEDTVNALLSFLYTLLKNDIQSALEGVGLDPAAGFLHTLRPGRPALALDMMEELRAPMCDRLALSLINLGQITKESFESLSAPVLLTEKARKTVVAAWQARKREIISHPFLQEKIPIGLIAFSQAQLLARVIRGDLDEYPPFHWR